MQLIANRTIVIEEIDATHCRHSVTGALRPIVTAPGWAGAAVGQVLSDRAERSARHRLQCINPAARAWRPGGLQGR